MAVGNSDPDSKFASSRVLAFAVNDLPFVPALVAFLLPVLVPLAEVAQATSEAPPALDRLLGGP